MNLLVEIRFKGLTYCQTLKAYDLALAEFKVQLTDLNLDYHKLEVFFSKSRLTLWLRLGQEDGNSRAIRETLVQAVTALLNRCKASLPEVWSDIVSLVVLFGSEVLPVNVDSLQAGAKTNVGQKNLAIRDTQHYWREMVRNKVLVDNEQREKAIRQLLAIAAAEAGGEVLSSMVMNEVVVSSEQPVLKRLEIQDDYMRLPEPLLKIIFADNLCFGLKSERGNLLNIALYVGNSSNAPPDLNAVLNEISLAYTSDLALTTEARRQLLSEMCYLSGLGSFLDKQKRMQKIVLTIADQVDAGENVCNLARQASELAKVDLTTKTCLLYPEFRGYMGGIIAEKDGFSEMVASAIVEHWCPGKYSSKLPHTLVGALLGIADRLDDICGHYYQNEFKLSHYRCVKAWFDEVIAIMDSVALDVSLGRLLRFSLSLYESQGLVPWREKDLAYLLKVFADRLYCYLLEREYSEGIANALTVIRPDNVFTTLEKAKTMREARHEESLESCAEVCRILDRTCAREYNYQEAAREFLEQPEEKDLFEFYLVAKDEIDNSLQERDYPQVLTRLARLKPSVLRFVNSVDLDTEDKPVQYNRLSLLSEIRQLFHSFADFSMI